MNARLAGEARKHALSCKIAERIADIGRAENQPVDIRVQGAAVEELEAEIDRLQHRLENQARTIKVQAATVARLESETQEFVTSLKDGLSAYKLVLRGDIYLTDRQIAALAFAQIGKDSS